MRDASQTALLAAAGRRRSTERALPLCHDPWAGALAGEAGEAFLEELLLASPGEEPSLDVLIGLRTGYLDAHVLAATRGPDAVRQVVVLGAGLDSRAARLSHQGVSYYEVDHPESQAYKLRQLRKVDGYPVGAAVYVSCDFEHADYLELLRASGFRPEEPAIFLLEGVVHYLSQKLVRRALEPIARRCHPRSAVLFDCLSSVEPTHQGAFEIGAERGEPVLWTSDDLLPFLRDVGFRHVRTTPFDQICMSMTGDCCAKKSFIHTCFLVRAVVEASEPAYLW